MPVGFPGKVEVEGWSISERALEALRFNFYFYNYTTQVVDKCCLL
jgi:hypothetical protein